ncbi:MAG: PD-(D/E)XK nuclease family protein [Candidatus Caldatribacterium sp.]|nr:PD-(D/E)XK nuclease family protein [Candidatus Caldatribacterium sp.]
MNFSVFEVAVLLAFFVAVVVWGTLRIEAWRRRRVLRRSLQRARTLERRAVHFLEEKGFRCVGEQVEKEAFFLVDGRRVPFRVRIDYLLEREGKKYVAEVKTGKQAETPENPSVRRQLLEYALLFAPCSVLFVDGEGGKVHEVSFPWVFSPLKRMRWMWAVFFLGGFLIGRWGKWT